MLQKEFWLRTQENFVLVLAGLLIHHLEPISSFFFEEALKGFVSTVSIEITQKGVWVLVLVLPWNRI